MASTNSNQNGSDIFIEKNEIPTQKRGLFIVFEGVDRSGKTTLTKDLIQMLNRNSETTPSELMRFPEYSTPTGKIIQQYLQTVDKKTFSKEFIHLTFSANRWVSNCVVTPTPLVLWGKKRLAVVSQQCCSAVPHFFLTFFIFYVMQ